MREKLKFNDLTKEPAIFATMEGAAQLEGHFYWFDKNRKQVGRTCYTEQQIKEFIK